MNDKVEKLENDLLECIGEFQDRIRNSPIKEDYMRDLLIPYKVFNLTRFDDTKISFDNVKSIIENYTTTEGVKIEEILKAYHIAKSYEFIERYLEGKEDELLKSSAFSYYSDEDADFDFIGFDVITSIGNIISQDTPSDSIDLVATRLSNFINNNIMQGADCSVLAEFVIKFLEQKPFSKYNEEICAILVDYMITKLGYLGCIIFKRDYNLFKLSADNGKEDLEVFLLNELKKTYDLGFKILKDINK